LGPASEDKVARFLERFKEVVGDRGLDFVWRSVNKATLRQLGLTKRNCRDDILSLTVSNYCAGPEADYDLPGQVWIFGKRIADREIYIKLKLSCVEGTSIAKCISFHEAEYPLRYPYD
jgi:hypothetical protein